jgi:hypothetical protein
MKRYSDEELATIAEQLRKRLRIQPEERVDVLSVVNHFKNSEDPNWRITFQEAPSSYMRQARALAEPAKRRVHYSKGLMDELINGAPQAAIIFLEEICHVLLKHDARVLNHSVGVDVRANAMPELDAMEQEAERMGWFFLAPISEMYAVGTEDEIIRRYGLPAAVAGRYYRHIESTRNRMEGRRRELPGQVIDFLAEQRKRFPSNKKVSVSKPIADARPPSSAPSKAQYSGLLPQLCQNCGMPTVMVIGRCKQCRSCGDEDGCN